MGAVDQVKEYIQAGDIFQLVLSHRFKRRTFADPFEIYRCAEAGRQCLDNHAMSSMLSHSCWAITALCHDALPNASA